ncbi:MAG TPA: GAF domain-containing protein [Fibrobacteria bacterium]|nr:GAF domain-containing protein [Fibrobacteria bacterium]
MTPALRDEIQKILDRQGTSDPAFGAVAAKLMADFDAEAAVVYTLDTGTGMLKLRCHEGIDRASSEKIRFLCVGKGLSGAAAGRREPVQGIRDQKAACLEEREVLPEGSLFVPMLADDSLRGVLGIAKHFHREYAPDEVAALSAVGRLIASYLK